MVTVGMGVTGVAETMTSGDLRHSGLGRDVCYSCAVLNRDAMHIVLNKDDIGVAFFFQV